MFHEPGEVVRRGYLFHVDADGTVAGDGDEGEVAGVGEVELEPGVVGGGEGGFAVGIGREGQFPGGKVEVAAEDVAHCAVGGDEALAVFGEAEAGGAGALVRCECGVELVAARGGDAQGRLPDVDGVCGEVEGAGWGAPRNRPRVRDPARQFAGSSGQFGWLCYGFPPL